MKHQLPPPLTLDDNGKVTNLTEITRFAYLHDPIYRRTDAVSDLLKESYVARLERLVAVQIIERAEMRKQLIQQAAMIPIITVTTPQDAPDDAPAITKGLIGILVMSFAATMAFVGFSIRNHPLTLASLVALVSSAGYLLRRKGGVA